MKQSKLKIFIEIIGPVLASFGGMCFGLGLVKLFDIEINPTTLPIFISGIILIITDLVLHIIAGKQNNGGETRL